MKQADIQKSTQHIPTLSDQLNEQQEAALLQVEKWLPAITFELHSRFSPYSVSQNHLIAIGRLVPKLPDRSVPHSPYATLKEYWVLASIPMISDKIIIALTQENPQPFIDFITDLDSLSETADHLQHGFAAPIQHLILNQRGYQSYTLAEFSQLWPKLQIKKKRHAVSQTLSASIEPDDHTFCGLLVIFHNAQHPQIDNNRYFMKALAKTKRKLTQLALPARAYTAADDIPSALQSPPEIATESITAAADRLWQEEQANTTLEQCTPSAQDLQKLNQHKTHHSMRLYVLFSIFLLVSAIIFWTLH